MALVIFLVLAWVFIAALVTVKNRITIRELAFVLMVVVTLNTHLNIIFSDNLKFFSTTNKPSVYLALVLITIVILPLCETLAINYMFVQKKWVVRIAGFVAFAIVAGGLEKLSSTMHLITYRHWNYWGALSYYLLLFLFTTLLLKIFRRVFRLNG